MKTHKALLLASTLLFLAGSLPAAEPFSVVVLPDTQNYAEKFPDTYTGQTQWIRDNVEKENIKFVMHLGDIVQNHNEFEEQWQVADRAHRLLDGVVALQHVAGQSRPGVQGQGLLSRDEILQQVLRSAAFCRLSLVTAATGGETNDNNFCTFEAGGMKFLVISLEYAPARRSPHLGRRRRRRPSRPPRPSSPLTATMRPAERDTIPRPAERSATRGERIVGEVRPQLAERVPRHQRRRE